MAKFVLELGDWATGLNEKFKLADQAVIPIMKEALYEGAKVTANAVNRAADRNGVPWHCGISRFWTDADGPETSVGYRDADYFYNRYGKRTPVDLVVNVMNTGTSKVQGNHFFNRATKSAKPLAERAMIAKYSKEILKLLGE